MFVLLICLSKGLKFEKKVIINVDNKLKQERNSQIYLEIKSKSDQIKYVGISPPNNSPTYVPITNPGFLIEVSSNLPTL
jgi:hypothetical protein